MIQPTRVDNPRFLLAVSLLHDALNHAEMKHPNYDFPNLRKTAIIAEEAGEALRAALLQVEEVEQHGYMRPHLSEPTEDITHEVAQCGAMCLRYLMDVVQ